MNLVHKDCVFQDGVNIWATTALVSSLSEGGRGWGRGKQSNMLELFSLRRNLVPQGV